MGRMAGPPSTLITDLSRRVDQMARELASLRRARGPLPEQFRLARVVASVIPEEYDPVVSGLAEKVRYWTVIPLDILADADLRPTVNELTNDAGKWTVRAAAALTFDAYDIVAIHQATDGAWWIVSTLYASASDGGAPNDTTLINGCDINDCLTAGETWTDAISGDEDCEAVPHQLEFGGGLNLLSGAPRGCCEGRIWNQVDFPPESAVIRGGPMVLTRTTGKQWVGEWFECADLLNQATDCGPARWRWTVGSTTLNCTYRWESQAVTCSGTNNWVWDEVSPGVSDWTYIGNSCDCDGSGVEPPARPSGTGPYNGYLLAVPCYSTSDWEWVLASSPADGCPDGATCTGPDADPDGGSLGPPSSPPTGSGQSQTYYCAISVPAEGAWVLETDCLCGTAVAPTEPGLYDGQLMTTECLSPTDGGGYSEELTVRWRLNADLPTPKLELVDAAGVVYFVYVLAPPRPFCCLCANPFVFAGCGPLYRCPPYGAICVRPHVPNRCRVAPGCDATRVEITLSGFVGYSRLPEDATPSNAPCTQWPPGAETSLHWGLVNGTYMLTPSATIGACLASVQLTQMIEIGGGYDPFELEILITYRAAPGGLEASSSPGSCYDGVAVTYPAVFVELRGPWGCHLAVFTPDEPMACGVTTQFPLFLEQFYVSPQPISPGQWCYRESDNGSETGGLVEVRPMA